MRLNLDKKFLDLKGYELNQQMSETLANALAMSNSGNPAKMMAWAIKLINDGHIDIDEADTNMLKSFIESNQSMTNLAKYQLMQEF